MVNNTGNTVFPNSSGFPEAAEIPYEVSVFAKVPGSIP